MRQIVLDTETTGLSTSDGHRIIEIGCVEMVNRKLTNKHFHHYICPERDVDEGALEVHGITNEFLMDKPKFADIVHEFIEFVIDAELIIHNAPFDIGFLDYELSLLEADQKNMKQHCKVLDTLVLAREMHPGQKNNLDALCKRYEVNNSQRELHGALLDAEILADVYLLMTGGQGDLLFSNDEQTQQDQKAKSKRKTKQRPPLTVVHPHEDELAMHLEQLEKLDQISGGECLWKKL
ncbi:MAG: DNA polymerase III subunit epsilon [Gammaproteobacteria bacterium]